MKKIYINKNTIELYDSIDEMPITNFQKYNKYLLIDSGVGSNVDDIDSHIVRIAKFIKANSHKKALQELQNMRQNIYMINSEISPKYLAFAALIHKVNGKEITDLSDDNLKAILNDIRAIKHSTIIKFLEWLKKKVELELNTYFPGNFINPKEKEAYDKIKNRVLLVLDSIITGNDNSIKIEAIDIALTMMNTPKSFIGAESMEVIYDKQFETACLLIAQETSLNAKNMTALQFYNTLEILKQQSDAKTKAYNKHKRK